MTRLQLKKKASRLLFEKKHGTWVQAIGLVCLLPGKDLKPKGSLKTGNDQWPRSLNANRVLLGPDVLNGLFVCCLYPSFFKAALWLHNDQVNRERTVKIKSSEYRIEKCLQIEFKFIIRILYITDFLYRKQPD